MQTNVGTAQERMWEVFADGIPEFIMEFANTPAMLRLKGVGMHCGCEYTQFSDYVGVAPYSRWTHSVGVALIVWRFTQDAAQTIAGLLHDIAAPAFAHAIDFLYGDYIHQEFTEGETERLITESPEIMRLLKKHGLTVGQVADYHMYPVADNDSPRLSADRLEYTLGNALNHGAAGLDELRELFEDLIVRENEEGEPEIQFASEQCAVRFAWLSLGNSRIYASDDDRFAMQALADLLREALNAGAICEEDLHTTEEAVIGKICADSGLSGRWTWFGSRCTLKCSDVRPEDGGYWVKLDAKRRFIDPLARGRGRVTGFCAEYRDALEKFRSQSFDYWMSADI